MVPHPARHAQRAPPAEGDRRRPLLLRRTSSSPPSRATLRCARSCCLPAILFAALCSLNCLFIYAWEHEGFARGSARPASRYDPPRTRPSSGLGFAIAMRRCAAYPPRPCAREIPSLPRCALAAALLLALDRNGDASRRTHLRAAADLALLTPSVAAALSSMTEQTPANFDPIARPYRWMEYLTFGPALARCRNHFLPQTCRPPLRPRPRRRRRPLSRPAARCQPPTPRRRSRHQPRHARSAHAPGRAEHTRRCSPPARPPGRRARLRAGRSLRPHRHPLLSRLPHPARSRPALAPASLPTSPPTHLARLRLPHPRRPDALARPRPRPRCSILPSACSLACAPPACPTTPPPFAPPASPGPPQHLSLGGLLTTRNVAPGRTLLPCTAAATSSQNHHCRIPSPTRSRPAPRCPSPTPASSTTSRSRYRRAVIATTSDRIDVPDHRAET